MSDTQETDRFLGLVEESYQLINKDMDDRHPRKPEFVARRNPLVTMHVGVTNMRDADRIKGLERLIEDFQEQILNAAS